MENWFNIIGWFLSVVTATGNGFVILLIAKTRRLHFSANWLVLSLAVADFSVGIAVYPSGYFCHNSTACNTRVYIAFFWFFLHSSVSNLCSLTWDRYIAIVHPFKYNTSMTNRRPRVVIVIAWLIPLAISLSLCVGMYVTDSKTAWKVLRLTGVSAFDIVSCVLLFYAVVRILVAARAQSHQACEIELQFQSNFSSTEAGTSRRRRTPNTARFIIALAVFFLGCYVIVNFSVLCHTLSCPVSGKKAGHVVTCLLVLNSTVNPMVYALLKRDIKREISSFISHMSISSRSLGRPYLKPTVNGQGQVS
ncbi:octopamine receptor beta-1R-like [Orbicella faveolata]|uniref:octopamine receptor beta-1R-like n=1 Tax=Orbicella faveolata TaxID=48498 RepID=UPI0009E62112|nr:octopamine receptor beta-1R-like [Orbicella faveolata]